MTMKTVNFLHFRQVPELFQEDLFSRDGHEVAMYSLLFPVLQYTRFEDNITVINVFKMGEFGLKKSYIPRVGISCTNELLVCIKYHPKLRFKLGFVECVTQ